MMGRWMFRGIRFVLLAVVIAALLSVAVMSLWNWLMPALFALHRIGFWQALGFLVLARILFGGLRGRHGPPFGWRRRMMERWEQMSPEEREKFREGMRGRCGFFGSRTAERRV